MPASFTISLVDLLGGGLYLFCAGLLVGLVIAILTSNNR
jgi:hypothetical protein